MATTNEKPRAINRVQYSAIIGAAHVIEFYNRTIDGTIKAIANALGIEPDDKMGSNYYGHLSDELQAAGVTGDTPDQIAQSILRHYNLEVRDDA